MYLTSASGAIENRHVVSRVIEGTKTRGKRENGEVDRVCEKKVEERVRGRECGEEGDVRESIRKIEVVKIEGVRRGKDGEHKKGQTTERETRELWKRGRAIKKEKEGTRRGSPEGTDVKGEERKDIEDTRKGEEGMKGWREELIKMKGEIKEGIREQGRWMKEEMEEIRKEFKRMEIRWLQEREELKGEIKGLKEKVGKLEGDLREKVVGDRGNEKGKEEEIEKKIRGIERKLEIREREERRRNVIIKGLEKKEGGRREAVEDVLKITGAKVGIKEIKKIGGEEEKGTEMVVVRLENEQQKKEILWGKKKLKGRNEKIMEDWT
ncbi:hypothetical protein X777_10742 [Ooceraea biroi]|uniref:Uncharacterized protein n=1 Tax=Ooceraea biroi TaxID=2015173 RepID=A0A026W4A5_OOCBI|nr:hypothetical protein X777_10742 [Ooceraea biroi]